VWRNRLRSLVRRNRLRRRVERNQVSSPNPSLNLSSFGFIVTIVGEMVTRVSFASRGGVRREWRKRGLTRTSITLPMVYLSLVCRCPGQGECEDSSGLGRAKGCRRCCWLGYTGQTGAGLDRQHFGFRLMQMLGLVPEVVILVVGLESLQGGVVALRWRGGTVHGLPFVVLVLLRLERVGSLIVLTMVVFVEVALVGEMFWIVLTPLWSKWFGTGFTLLVLTQC
jgi:hypothetical protein